MEIQIGDTLDMQKGRMVYIGEGKADAQVFQAGSWVTIKAGVTLTAGQIEAWHGIKAKQAATPSSGNGIR